MEKKKITPILVATLLTTTAGIATGVHGFAPNSQEVARTSGVKTTSRTRKKNTKDENNNTQTEHQTISTDINKNSSPKENIVDKTEHVQSTSVVAKQSYTHTHNIENNIQPQIRKKKSSDVSSTVKQKIQQTSNQTFISKNIKQTNQNTINAQKQAQQEQQQAQLQAQKQAQQKQQQAQLQAQKQAQQEQQQAQLQAQKQAQQEQQQAQLQAQKQAQQEEAQQRQQNQNHQLILPQGNLTVNGSKISTQLQANTAIANTARSITSGYSSDYAKAQALYVWVARNITYNQPEERAVENGTNYDGSAIRAFNTRNGICEDFSTLYAVMANSVGLTVRVVGGQGYANGNWISHAWNEVYIPSMGWINVDCTFANSYIALIQKYNLPYNSAGLLSEEPFYTYKTSEYSYKIYTEDYFNTSNFSNSHTNAQVLAQLGNA